MEELKPCPFCGTEDISSGEVLVELPKGAGFAKQTMCRQCGALGPEAKVTERQSRGPEGDTAADTAWNRRASLVQGTEATAGGGATPGVAPSAETVERDGCDPSLLGKKIGYYPDGKPFGYITEQERADALAAYGVKEGQSG
jgi:Lar family restriction alleviation protein